jgi:ADP-heptose:LPS heptosyltransferase
LVAVPAFRAMRRAWPDARIELIGLPWAAALVDRLPGYVDRVVEFPGWPGIPERPLDAARVVAFLAASNADPPDLAIQLHGSGVATNAFVALLGAPRTAGQVLLGGFAPGGGTFVPFDERRSELRNALTVVEALGVEPAGEQLEVMVLERDREEAASGPAGRLPRGEYALVHPGSSTPSRRWPAERFARVADAVAEHVPVVVTGTDRERDVVASTIDAMRRSAIDAAGTTSLGGLFALVEGAALLVSNDTGVAHVADAVGTPSVVVFTTSDPARWGPRDRDLHRVVAGIRDAWPRADAVRREALDLLRIGVDA